MLKNISRLEHMVGDKVFHLLCDTDSPLDFVEEALFQFLSYVRQVKLAAQEKQKKELEEEKESKVEELKEENV